MSAQKLPRGNARDVLDFIDGIWAYLGERPVAFGALRCARWTHPRPVRWE